MKKTKIVAVCCIIVMSFSVFAACDLAFYNKFYEKETAAETTKENQSNINQSNKNETDKNETSATENPENTNGTADEDDVDFENMSQDAAYKYVCDVVKRSSNQEKISVFYNNLPSEGEPAPEGFYMFFMDRTNGWKAYEPDPSGFTQGSWIIKDNGKYIRYVKDEVINWETMETMSYREILSNELDWEYDMFASYMGLCTNEDMAYTGFIHVVNSHDCEVEITKTDESVTIRFTPLQPIICDVCDDRYYTVYDGYEYTITDGLLSKATILSSVYGYTVDITYKCASFDVPSNEEYPLK